MMSKNKGKRINDKVLKKSGSFRKVNDSIAVRIADRIYFYMLTNFNGPDARSQAKIKKDLADIIMNRKWEYSQLFGSGK